MVIADWQVKVADAGPAVRYEVLAQEESLGRKCVAISDCRQGPGFTAIAPSQMYGRAKAIALPRLASMICIGDARPIPIGQLYVMQHAVRGEAEVAAASS